jgi:K+-sensing histidine kinase KdpD
MLGARLRVEEGEDVAAVAAGVARALGSTYVMIGTPTVRRGLSRLPWPRSERSLLNDLLRELPGVDVRVVADPSLRRAPGGDAPPAAGVEGEVDERVGAGGTRPSGQGARGPDHKSF